MQENIAAFHFATLNWWAFVSGVASILGCYLPSIRSKLVTLSRVYRGLIWEKSLLWSVGIGFVVASTVLIYNQPAPDPNTRIGRIYESVTNSSGPSETSTGNLSGTTNTVSGTTNTVGGSVTNTGELSAINTGGSSAINTGGSSAFETSGGDYGSQLWFLTFAIGVVIILFGYNKQPFAAILAKLKLLDKELDARREEFRIGIKGASEASTASLMEIYDRNADLTRAALFYMLTGYHLQRPSTGGSYLTPSEIRMIASLMKLEADKPKTQND